MRLQRAFSHAASVPWLMFLWGAAEVGERVEYIADKEHRVWGFIMSPMGGVILVVSGLISIIGVIMWPNVKHAFAWAKIPPNPHDTLTARIAGLNEALAESIKHQGAATQILTEFMHTSEATMTSHTKLINSLDSRVSRDIADLKRIVERIPGFTACTTWLILLSDEGSVMLDEWNSLRRKGVPSASIAYPFAIFWKEEGYAVQPEEQAEIDQWGQALIRHISRCNVVDSIFELTLFTDQTKTLRDCSQGLRCKDVDHVECAKLITEHVSRLRFIRDNYAASLLVSSVRATTS
jgi:hypothetical protein